MYFDTDTLLKYTDPKFFVTHLLWICYLLYHCKRKVFIKLFIENKGLHWSLKNERTKATHIWELGSSVLNVCTTNLCVEFTQLSSNRELTPCRLPFWNISYSLNCSFYFRSGFLSEDLRVPLVMLPLKKKIKIKLTKHFRGWIATAPHFSFCSSNISHHILAALTSPWRCLCFTHPVL